MPCVCELTFQSIQNMWQINRQIAKLTSLVVAMTRIESHTFGDHFRKEKSCQNLWMKGTIIMISGVISVETEVMLFYVISVNLCFTGIA